MKRNIYTATLIRLLILFIMSLTICGLIGLLCSCRTCRQESAIERSDSYMRNTVFTLVKGDMVFVKEWHWRVEKQINL